MDKKTREVLAKFEQINQIPRCSKHEEKISRWLQQWAGDRGHDVRKDSAGNMCIKVPATAGFENSPIITLQGHMDMVCEKRDGSSHDFDRDPIRVIYGDEWVTADETTLGADNGIALAIALVLAEDSGTIHPPLELLFTVDEESGLIGAKALDPDIFEGKILVNIDSEEEGEFTVGCAGGEDTRIRLDLDSSALPENFRLYDLAVHGLRGGHSGIDIHKHRANANKLIARALDVIQKTADIRIVRVKGGTVHNAIARDATARIALEPTRSDRVKNLIVEFERTLQSEFSSSESSIDLSFGPAETGVADSPALTAEETVKMIHLLLTLPHGVAGMSADIEGLVETSNNLATLDISHQALNALSSQRSSVLSRLDEITARVQAAAALSGAKSEMENSYPAWQPDMASLLLERCKRVYADLYGKEPLVRLIHAGLECGIIGAKKAGMDMISFGPTIRYPHSPEEKLYIPSINKIWSFLTRLLQSYTQ